MGIRKYRAGLGPGKYILRKENGFAIGFRTHHGFIYEIDFTKQELMAMTGAFAISALPPIDWPHEKTAYGNGGICYASPPRKIREIREAPFNTDMVVEDSVLVYIDKYTWNQHIRIRHAHHAYEGLINVYLGKIFCAKIYRFILMDV